MKLDGVKKSLVSVTNVVRENSPSLLVALGVAGIATTVVMAVKATPQALYNIETREAELGAPISPRDKFDITWRLYAPSFMMGVVTAGCFIGSHSINLKRNATIAGLYSLTEGRLKEYQEKVLETIGEKKEQAIREEIAQDRINSNPVTDTNVIITGKGDMLCYDSVSGRYFKGNIENLRKIQNDINHELFTEMTVPLNKLYYDLGLSGIKLGDEMGWTVDKLVEFDFTSKLTETGEPCLVLDYEIQPFFGHRSW